MLADERHEAHGAEILIVEFVLAIAHHLDQALLEGGRAKWHHEAAADFQLAAQRFGNFRSTRGDDDGVERRRFGPA